MFQLLNQNVQEAHYGTFEPSSSLTTMFDECLNDNDSLASDPFLWYVTPWYLIPQYQGMLKPCLQAPAATNLHPTSKKHKVSTQGIQRMQLEVLTLENKKNRTGR